MSSQLKWKPVNAGVVLLPSELKYIFHKKYLQPVRTILRDTDIPFLDGLQCAGVVEAKILIDAILKYGEIEVFEDY